MAARFYLVRHALYPRLGQVLVGRMAGTRLSAEGRRQACRLAEKLSDMRLTLIQSSPRARARATALPIARRAALPIEVAPALDEIDMGEWTGRSFAALSSDPRWHRWNAARSSTRPPGGESMWELQQRTLQHVERLYSANPNGRFLLVSHAEPIRALLLHFLRLPLDEFVRVDVGPATISTITMDERCCRVISVNEMASA